MKVMQSQFLAVSFLIALLVSSTGCVPIQRMEMSTSDQKIGISPEKYVIAVSVLTQTSDPAQQPVIDTNHSFAVSPSGKRFNVRVQKNEYADNDARIHKTPWRLDDLSLVDPLRQTGTGNSIPWKNGQWKLDLFFTPPTDLEPVHSEFRIYTFWWCPIITRPF